MGPLSVTWAVLLGLGMPIAFTLGVAALLFMWWNDMPLVVIPQRMVGGIDSFPLLAVPFFILAGNLMNTSGITDRIFHFSHSLIGHMRGGLAQVNVLASVIFSGMSGSAVADAGGLGAMEIKAMREAGYRPAFAGAVTVASCIVGPLIPPSIPMVIYGVLADASIGRLFLGGVVPGLMTAGSLMVMITLMARRQNFPTEPKATWSETGRASQKAFLPLMTPFIIIGGIMLGIFSPTEAAIVASLYALVLGVFVYRELSAKDLWTVILQTGRTTASICFIIATATVFAWVITTLQVPQQAAAYLVGLTRDPLFLLLIINLVVFIAGFFLEGLAIMILVVPVMIPTMAQVGIDPVHFGVVLVFNLMIGLMTPPMGIGLFVVSGVAGIKLEDLIKEVFPFLIPLLIVLLLLIFIPSLVTALPDFVLGADR
ncbi:TRAP transporter large permease [Microvirga sp. BT689]|uniref:TRAP transporter large permease n=1 Tax=Microvirga arvi TaxID=2778731 RepID=UPI00194F3E48|nr:TRAP transporter large permease [Microvirga arvi]MBM6581291.1 TRAP transporter large permease [Microvirga arvi]